MKPTTTTINERLDKEYPATCHACKTPYKRTDGKWIDGAVRNICPACGLDQSSAEAAAIWKRSSLPL